MKKIIPTIGRIVLFHLDGESKEQAAIIANVHSDSCVNLAIFDGNGKPMAGPPTSITLVQPGEKPPEAGYYCRWMDYQIEQAAKESPAALEPVGDDASAANGEPDAGQEDDQDAKDREKSGSVDTTGGKQETETDDKDKEPAAAGSAS